MKAKLKFQGKEIEIADIDKAKGIRKYTGLMFKRKETNALLFEFEKPCKQAIHSLFCRDFLAIWLDSEGKIAEYKIIFPNQFSIKPEKEFSKLLEIPINKKYSGVISPFILRENLPKEKLLSS